jgi:restriction system protein
MTDYWVIAPYDSNIPEVFERAWSYDKENGTIAVGWTELGDISELSKSEIREKLEDTYPSMHKGQVTRDTNCLWSFYHEVSIGDTMIARQGTKRIIGIGKVTRTAFYDEDMGRERLGDESRYYPHFICVDWKIQEIDFDRIMFSFYTMYKLPGGKERFEQMVKEETLDEEEITEAELEFALETHLEEFIVKNFDTVFEGNLKVYTDDEGNRGKQYRLIDSDGTFIGIVDILAVDLSDPSYVVIELKKGKESDVVVGQILRYMGFVQEYLCDDTQSVKGIVICRDKDVKLDYALRFVGDKVRVKYYHMDFELHDEPR